MQQCPSVLPLLHVVSDPSPRKSQAQSEAKLPSDRHVYFPHVQPSVPSTHVPATVSFEHAGPSAFGLSTHAHAAPLSTSVQLVWNRPSDGRQAVAHDFSMQPRSLPAKPLVLPFVTYRHAGASPPKHAPISLAISPSCLHDVSPQHSSTELAHEP